VCIDVLRAQLVERTFAIHTQIGASELPMQGCVALHLVGIIQTFR